MILQDNKKGAENFSSMPLFYPLNLKDFFSALRYPGRLLKNKLNNIRKHILQLTQIELLKWMEPYCWS